MRKKISLAGIIIGGMIILAGIVTYMGAFSVTPNVVDSGKVAKTVIIGAEATNTTISHIGGLLIIAIGLFTFINQLLYYLKITETDKKYVYVYDSDEINVEMSQSHSKETKDYSAQPFVVDDKDTKVEVPLFMVDESPVVGSTSHHNAFLANEDSSPFIADDREEKVHSFLASNGGDDIHFTNSNQDSRHSLKDLLSKVSDRLTFIR